MRDDWKEITIIFIIGYIITPIVALYLGFPAGVIIIFVVWFGIPIWALFDMFKNHTTTQGRK